MAPALERARRDPAACHRSRWDGLRPRRPARVLLAVGALWVALVGCASTPAGATSPQSVTSTEAPVPTGGGRAPSLSMQSVSCPSTGSCVAVLDEYSVTDSQAPVIETLSAGSWTAQDAPIPAGADAFESGEELANVEAVACSSASSCVAVGYYDASAGGSFGLIETLSGGTWTATAAPEPANAGGNGTGTQSAELFGVSCPAVGACVAVGNYDTTSSLSAPLVDTLSAGSWSALAPPAPSPNDAVGLTAVACPSTSACDAAGYWYDTSFSRHGLLETLASGSWSDTSAPLPSGAASNPGVYFTNLACPAAGSCVAVGQYSTSSSVAGLIESLSAGTWAATKEPAPSGGGSGSSALLGDACTSAGSCLVSGNYSDSAGHSEAAVDTLAAGSWSATFAPEPSNAGTDASGKQDSSLGALSCPAAGSCVAVGTYEDSSGEEWGMIDTLASGSWTTQQATEPSNAGTDAAGTQSAGLSSLACPAAGSCVAIGDYDDTHADGNGLIETLSGSWTATEAPFATVPATDPDVSVLGAACASASSCVAAGSFADIWGYQTGLLETLSSGTWSAVAAPEPSGAGTDAEGRQGAGLSAVACPAAGSCAAVGHYEDSSQDEWGLLETLSSGTWSATKAPMPSGAGDLVAALPAVSCGAVGSCVAVGDYWDTSYAQWGLIERLSSGTWTVTKGPEPSNAGSDGAYTQNAILDAVSCPSSSSCVAVGDYEDSSGKTWGLIETLSSGTWTATQAPEPSGSGTDADGEQSAVLSAVSCSSATSCVAVGHYEDSSGDTWGLIETLSGGTWTATQAPEPTGAGSDAGTSQSASLAAVACPSAATCVAVGTYDDSSKDAWGELVSLSGGSWSATQASEPSGAGSDSSGTQSATLSSVGCPSSTWCVAAGSYEDSAAGRAGYLQSGAPGSWSLTATPEPAGAGTDSGGTQEVMASTVACASDGSCLDAGSYLDSGATTEGLFDAVTPPAPVVGSISPTSGVAGGGNSVTITGSWFFPASTVAFGANPASVGSVSPSTISVLSPSGTGAIDVRVTDAGGTSPAVPGDQFTYPGGTITLESSSSLFFGFALNGYDQWSSGSASALSGCSGSGGGTICSGGSEPTLEVADTTGAGAGWAISAYVTSSTLPSGSVLDFDGAGAALAGFSSAAPLASSPYAAQSLGDVCDSGSGCLPAEPASTCAHGFSSCPVDPVDVLAATSPSAQLDLYSAAAGSGEGLICMASGTASAPGCVGTTPDDFYDLGLPGSARVGSYSATIVLTVSSGP